MCEKSVSLDETLDLDIHKYPELKQWARYALGVTPARRDLPSYKELITIRDESLEQFQKLSRDYIDAKRQLEFCEAQLYEQGLTVLRNKILLAPIRTVPDDILGKIFIFTGAGWARHYELCAEDCRSSQVLPFEENDTFTLKSIMRVSREWYRVANLTPALWSNLLLCQACRPFRTWKPTQHWISRTAHLPMTVFLHTGTNHDAFEEFLDRIPILQCIQIRSCNFYPSFLRNETPHRMTIKTLDLSVENSWEESIENDPPLVFPQLENLRISFPSTVPPTFLSPLRKLALCNMTLDPTDVKYQLELVPSLVSLRFEYIEIRSRASSSDDVPEVDIMPNLIDLSIVKCSETTKPSFFRWLQRTASHIQTFRLDAGTQLPVENEGSDDITRRWGGDPLYAGSVRNFIYRATFVVGSNEFSKWMHLEKLQRLTLASQSLDWEKYDATTIVLAFCQGPDTALPSLLELTLEGMSFDLSALLSFAWARSYSPYGVLSVTNPSTISKCDVTLKRCDYIIGKATRPIPDIRCATWSELNMHFSHLDTRNRRAFHRNRSRLLI